VIECANLKKNNCLQIFFLDFLKKRKIATINRGTTQW
jgi:hypothetical protein